MSRRTLIAYAAMFASQGLSGHAVYAEALPIEIPPTCKLFDDLFQFGIVNRFRAGPGIESNRPEKVVSAKHEN